MERNYVALGGKFLPDDEQEVMTTPYYTQCVAERGSAASFRYQADRVEASLRWIASLLHRKKALLRASARAAQRP
jgi:hypothetical protein